jgi:hypothetical protein
MIRFGLTFQEEIEPVEGTLRGQDSFRVKALAFPRRPSQQLLEDTSRRAFRVMPFDDERLLLTVGFSGQLDRFERPALRVRGCIIEAYELQGPMRDLAAVWHALDSTEASAGPEEFQKAVSARSALVVEPALETMLTQVRENPSFASAAVLALTRPQVVLRCAADSSRVLESLGPLLLLLPLSHVLRLELSTETHFDSGERVAGSTVSEPPRPERRRGLPALFLGQPAVDRVWVDLIGRQIEGLDGRGPRWLVDELVNPAPWPGLSVLDRHRIIQECLDAPVHRGYAITPWELSNELAGLSNVIARIDNVSRRLKKGEWVLAPQRKPEARGGERD